MKGKLSLLALALLAVGLAAAVHFSSTAQAQSSSTATPSFTTSRYALISGPVSIRSELKNGESKTENGIFRIDTYSGTVWMLDVSTNAEGNRNAVWVPIGNK